MGCSVAVVCLAIARTSCLTEVRTLPLTRRLSFPILPLGPWLSSPRRSLSTPLSTSRARSGITHEYSSTGRLSPYPSDAPSHESSSRDQTVANYHSPRLHRICALDDLNEKSFFILDSVYQACGIGLWALQKQQHIRMRFEVKLDHAHLATPRKNAILSTSHSSKHCTAST